MFRKTAQLSLAFAIACSLPAAAQQSAEPGDGIAHVDEDMQAAAHRANAEKWDEDGNGTITGAEFQKGWDERDIFSRWDENGDGNLTSEELARGFLAHYDADGSNALEEYELDDFGRDMGTDGFFGEG